MPTRARHDGPLKRPEPGQWHPADRSLAVDADWQRSRCHPSPPQKHRRGRLAGRANLCNADEHLCRQKGWRRCASSAGRVRLVCPPARAVQLGWKASAAAAHQGYAVWRISCGFTTRAISPSVRWKWRTVPLAAPLAAPLSRLIRVGGVVAETEPQPCLRPGGGCCVMGGATTNHDRLASRLLRSPSLARGPLREGLYGRRHAVGGGCVAHP